MSTKNAYASIIGIIISIALFTVLFFFNNTKADVIPNEPLSFIKLKVLDKDNIPIEGIAFDIYKDNELVSTIVSGSDGIATSQKLPLGEYTYKMGSCNNYYLLDPTVYTINLREAVEDITTIVANANYSLTIRAINKEYEPIKNMIFDIYKDDTFIGTTSSDRDGFAYIEGLTPGGYTYKIRSHSYDIISNDFIICDKNIEIDLAFLENYVEIKKNFIE